MSDDSIPQRATAEQRIAAAIDALTDPASRAIVAVLADVTVVFALRITLYSWRRGDRAEYEQARAHLLQVLRMHRDFFTVCGRDDARVQEHIDYFLWLDWLRLQGVEIAPPDMPVPRVAKLNPRTQGKSAGDGSYWPGGLDDFLDDLWTALEKRRAATGTPYGHDPTAKRFLEKMRATPGERTMYTWLRKAGLRPGEIEGGKVTRENYQQFVAKKQAYDGRQRRKRQ